MISIDTATLSVEEAAKILGIGRSLAYDLARRGELPGVVRLGQKQLRGSRYSSNAARAPPTPRRRHGVQTQSEQDDIASGRFPEAVVFGDVGVACQLRL